MKGKHESGENYIMRSLMTCTVYQTLFVWPTQEEWDCGRGVAWPLLIVALRFWWENPKERHNLGRPRRKWEKISKRMLKKWNAWSWMELILFGVYMGDWLLWIRLWTFLFNELWIIPCQTGELAVSEWGLCSMHLFTYIVQRSTVWVIYIYIFQ